MKTIRVVFFLLSCCAVAAQTPKLIPDGSTPLARGNAPGEEHHHLVLENSYVRAYNVVVPAHGSTLLHRHDEDYVYVAIGPADVVNAVLDKPEIHLQLKDGEIHFARGGFSHVARNLSDAAFQNVTIALLRPQGTARNQCEPIVPGPVGECHKAQVSSALSQTPEFETDEVQVTLSVLEPKGRHIEAEARNGALLVALEKAELEVKVSGKPAVQMKSSDVLWLPPGTTQTLTNRAAGPSRFLLVYFKDSATPKSAGNL